MINQDDLKAHVLSAFPNEACGIVVKNKYIPLKNIHPEPLTNFRIDPVDMVQYGEVEAVIHSHIINPRNTIDPRTPSTSDQESQQRSDITYGIVATDGHKVTDVLYFGDDIAIPPLEGREFVHGVLDCYSILRDYYRLNFGIKIKNWVRDWNWWLNAQDLYTDENLASIGFHKIAFTDIKAHDVILFKVNSPVPNHCGVYIQHNTFIHQLGHRLSGTESLNKYRKFIWGVYRYKDELK